MTKELIIEIFNRIAESNMPVIVEGKKDSASLRKLGITNTLELSKAPIYAVVEKVVKLGKECVILTDLDRKGKELYGKLNSQLQQHGVKVNNELREFLFRHTELRQIEGLAGYIEKMD